MPRLFRVFCFFFFVLHYCYRLMWILIGDGFFPHRNEEICSNYRQLILGSPIWQENQYRPRGSPRA